VKTGKPRNQTEEAPASQVGEILLRLVHEKVSDSEATGPASASDDDAQIAALRAWLEEETRTVRKRRRIFERVWLTAPRLLKQAAPMLARLEDVRLVGLLVEILEFGGTEVGQAAQKTLTVLLPRLQAGDADLLSEAQRAILYRRLAARDEESENFRLAILQALERVGDGKALPVVERLAAEETDWSSQRTSLLALEERHPSVRQARIRRDQCFSQYTRARAKRTTILLDELEVYRRDYEEAEAAYRAACEAVLYPIRRAARHCLPVLRERAEKERLARTLLRPAAAPPDLADTLLRPAQGVSEADAALLLRPAEPGSEGAAGSRPAHSTSPLPHRVEQL